MIVDDSIIILLNSVQGRCGWLRNLKQVLCYRLAHTKTPIKTTPEKS